MRQARIPQRSRRLVAAAASTVSLVLAMSACGAGGAADSTGDGNAASADNGQYQEILDGLYKGTYQEPNGPVVAKPATGKNIWVIPPGLNGEVYAEVADGAKEAGKKLGWDVTVLDAKFSPTEELAGVQQAVAGGADGIILYAIDCSAVKNGLDAAKAAGIPTINIAGSECDSPSYAYTVAYPGFDNYMDYIRAFGKAQAEYAIAKTQGKAKVILTTQTDLEVTRNQADATRAALADCSGCEVVGDVEFVGADFGPQMQSKISQALLKAPDADVFIATYDAILTAGGAQALRASGRLDQTLVVSGEGSVDGVEMIRAGSGMDACLGYDAGMEAYGAINYLVLIFDGQDPSGVNNGVGWQACDKDHNLPADGDNFQSPVDFRSVYDRLWSLG